MRSSSPRFPSIGLALVACATWWAPAGAQPPSPDAKPPVTAAEISMFRDPEYVIGSAQAKVTVAEYASASCPHCARFDINVFPSFKKKYIDTGKVRYIFREFLTPPEDVAAAGFLLARCSGGKNYFHVVDQVFHDQEEIYRTGDVKGIFARIGGSVGLSEPQIDACLTDKNALDALNARVKDAVETAKINSTPSFLIDGKLFRGDPHKEMDLAQLDSALAPLLASPARGHHHPLHR